MANVYISYANELRKLRPCESKIIEELLDKASKMDMENKDILHLKFDMNFDGVLIKKF